MLTTSMFVLLFLYSQSFILSAKESTFNHDKTGFELVGPHERLTCDSCHIRGIFKGIPKQCESCHDSGSQIANSIKPSNHIVTTGSCEGCHAGNTWVVTGFNHDSVTGTCISCHNGTTTTGKPFNHVQSTETCDDCHSQVAWSPARFDHTAVTGSCVSCHNGVTARGKSSGHISSSNSCDNCHITVTWTTNRVDHNDVVGGSCITCHNGTTATGKPINHIASGTVCDDCHSTVAWSPANVDHDSITGTCSSCHNSITAVGPSTDHFITPLQCDTCHSSSTKGWPSIYTHSGVSDYPNHAKDIICTQCHTSNDKSLAWIVSYAPYCSACHSNKFAADKHLKTTNPDSFYTLDELQNCSNSSCHITDVGTGDVTNRVGKHINSLVDGW